MKLPRDVSGDELINRLAQLGFKPTRQTGSHVRLTLQLGHDTCHATVPRHGQLKVGTLNSILRQVSVQLRMDKGELIEALFRN